MKKILITGSSGLIGSEVSVYFSAHGYEVHGVDNNQRAVLFGAQGDTRWNQKRLQSSLARFHHHELDIRDRVGVHALIKELRPHFVVHAAAQPSHDLAAKIPFDDFDINAGGTLNLLEAVRQNCADSPFVHMSTNKVYGDGPNRIAMTEGDKRWEISDPLYSNGIPEDFPIDHTTHSLFGASKVSADVFVQEYGRYFGMSTCCLRGGCLTGPNHSGVELHGFLSYLVKVNLESKVYRVFGYKGKQVRDNIHSLDVARFIQRFLENPRQGVVYNLGGGQGNSCSIWEAFDAVAALTGKKMNYEYVPENRKGDHICYYSDLSRIKRDYPGWDIQINLGGIFEQIIASWSERH